MLQMFSILIGQNTEFKTMYNIEHHKAMMSSTKFCQRLKPSLLLGLKAQLQQCMVTINSSVFKFCSLAKIKNQIIVSIYMTLCIYKAIESQIQHLTVAIKYQ